MTDALKPSARAEAMAKLAKEAADAEVQRHLAAGHPVHGRRDGKRVVVQPVAEAVSGRPGLPGAPLPIGMIAQLEKQKDAYGFTRLHRKIGVSATALYRALHSEPMSARTTDLIARWLENAPTLPPPLSEFAGE